MTRLGALWPAVLLALVAGFTGGVGGATRFPHAWIGYAAVLATSLAGAAALVDPLRLGRGRWLLGAVVVSLGASVAASALPRAGLVGALLLPAWLLLPAAVGRLLPDAASRRLAVAAWGAAVAGLAAWSLADLVWRGAARTAAPVGTPESLAVVLAAALPVAAAGWRERGAYRVVAAAAVVLGVGALAATRSLVGLLALGVAAWVASRRAGHGRELLLGVALLALGLAVPRLAATVSGDDAAAIARLGEARAAWNGARERPLLGWGPGTSPWTMSGFVAPRPGPAAAETAAGGARWSPAALAFELGLPPLALWIAVALAFARARRQAPAVDPPLAVAAGAALAGVAVALSAGASPALPAFAVTGLIVAGFALAGESESPPLAKRWQQVSLVAYVVAAAGLLTPAARAHRAYEAALHAGDPARRAEELDRAVRLDPHFPLYRARAAWGDDGAADGEVGDWRELGAAAAAAQGVSALWLRAAAAAHAAGEDGPARQAAARAMAFDRLSGAAPFLIHRSLPRDVDCAARSLLAEPKLAAATAWRGRERERLRVLARVASWKGVDARWRREFVRQAQAAAPGDGPSVELVTRIDAEAATAISPRLFRRSPWPAAVARIELDRDAARRIRVPRASDLVSSAASAFPARRCAPR